MTQIFDFLPRFSLRRIRENFGALKAHGASELESFVRVCPSCAIEYNFLATNDPPEKCWDCDVELIKEDDML